MVAEHHHPLAAVGRLMTGAHAAWPAVNDPVEAPPVKDPGVPQPEAMVNFVPEAPDRASTPDVVGQCNVTFEAVASASIKYTPPPDEAKMSKWPSS